MNDGPKKQKNKTRKANEQTEYTPQHIYDCEIFELAIRPFDIHIGWRDAYKRQCEYMRRDLFMGKLNPDKFSQRMQDLNKYLDYIPIEITTLTDKTKRSYGKLLPEDGIRSITGRTIPPEWRVNLLALGKEPWRFKYLEDQLNMHRQQWQADQQKQIIAKMAGKMSGKSNDGKGKIMKETIIIMLIFALLPRLTMHTYPVWAPIHAIIHGYLCRQSYLHYMPPFPAQGKATR
jgi:hypothetical protein